MMELSYDISKNKMKIKANDKEAIKEFERIIRTIAICGTLLIGFNLYLEYKKYAIQ